MPTAHSRGAAALTALLAAGLIGLVPSAPAQAEPDIDDVKTQVEDLYHEAEQAQERYNDATLELDRLDDELDSLEADQERQDDDVDAAADEVRDTIIRQYQGQSLSAAGELMVSEDSDDFLDQMSALDTVETLQDEEYDDYATELKKLEVREDAVSDRRDEVADLEAQLADEKDTVDEKLSDAKALLARLEDEQAESLLAGETTEVGPVDAAGNAQAAVDYAMAQVGKSYVYGAAGPDAFDCSGLTMMAWAQAGVALPHSSSAQYGTGTPVSSSELQPGDLVFYYSPISHVAMYIGNGMIVHAANPGAGVKVSPLNEMPYVGAVRPG